MNTGCLTTFTRDIKTMDFETAFDYTARVVSFIEDTGLKLEDYNNIRIFAYSLGMLDYNNKLLEQYHVLIEDDVAPMAGLLPTNKADNVNITSGKENPKSFDPNKDSIIYEDKLTEKEREKLKDSDFGIPELRKYPLIDKNHVIKAIQFFDSCPRKYKSELKKRILKKAKEYGVTSKMFREAMENNDVEEVLNEASNNKKLLREQAMKMILDSIGLVDKGGKNVKKYKEMYEKMTDDQFHKHMIEFLQDDYQNFYLEILPNKSEPKMKDIEALLEYNGVPQTEYVYFRHDGDKDDPVRTKCRVPVGLETIRRVQQILSKKNTYSLDIDKRDSKTGQVSGESKIARIADTEAIGLRNYGAEYALKEFFGPRADNQVSKTEMYKQIAKYGYVYYDDLPYDITKSQTLLTTYTYMMGAGLANDLMCEPEDMKEKRKN